MWTLNFYKSFFFFLVVQERMGVFLSGNIETSDSLRGFERLRDELFYIPQNAPIYLRLETTFISEIFFSLV